MTADYGDFRAQIENVANEDARLRATESIVSGKILNFFRKFDRPFPPYRCCKRVLDIRRIPAKRSRFHREAQAAANIDHPNILPIHEVSDNEAGLPFFSRKFASAGSLETLSPHENTLNSPKSARVSTRLHRASGKCSSMSSPAS